MFGDIGVDGKIGEMFAERDVLIHLDRFSALCGDEGLAGEFEGDARGDDAVLNFLGVIPILDQFHGRSPGLDQIAGGQKMIREILIHLADIDARDEAERGLKIRAAVEIMRGLLKMQARNIRGRPDNRYPETCGKPGMLVSLCTAWPVSTRLSVKRMRASAEPRYS